jgi:hypothetical protein
MAILETKFSLTHLQLSLDLRSIGKLSSMLINPYNLSVILQQVSFKLPTGMSMLTGLTAEGTHLYYTTAIAHAVATCKSIRSVVNIPLTAANRYFELYQVQSLRFFHEGINRFARVDKIFSHIAVAENRQFLAMMKPYMLAKYVNTERPSDLVLRTPGEANCVTELFLGKADVVP